MDKRPIGVMDSGLGGLTCVRQLIKLAPGEDIVYFGDTARVPYGTKGKAVIEQYTKEDHDFLVSQKVKIVISACGTVSTTCPNAGERLPVDYVDVVIPSVKAACKATKNGRIGVIATAASINTDRYRTCIKEVNSDYLVYQQACPLLVPLVESGWVDRTDKVTIEVVRRYLDNLAKHDIDVLIMGCTHYPILEDIIRDIMGEHVLLIDSGYAAASAAISILQSKNLLNTKTVGGNVKYYVTDMPEGFSSVASSLLGFDITASTAQITL